MPCHVWYISCSFTNPTILVDLFSPTKIHSMRKFLTTPFPFPLVQMARTFLFFCTFPTSACVLFCLAKCDSVILLTHSLVQFWQTSSRFLLLCCPTLVVSMPIVSQSSFWRMDSWGWNMFPSNWTIHLERMITILTISVWHMYVPNRSPCPY